MALISLICKQCGGSVELDESREYGFCSHCGTKVVVKEDIIQQTNVTHQSVTKNIFSTKGKDAEELIADGETLFNIGEWENAAKKFRQAIDAEPNNWQAWLRLAESGGEGNPITALCASYKLAPEPEKPFVFETMCRFLKSRVGKPHEMKSYREAYATINNEHKEELFALLCHYGDNINLNYKETYKNEFEHSYDNHRFHNAEEAAWTALKLKPKNPQALFAKAKAYQLNELLPLNQEKANDFYKAFMAAVQAGDRATELEVYNYVIEMNRYFSETFGENTTFGVAAEKMKDYYKKPEEEKETIILVDVEGIEKKKVRWGVIIGLLSVLLIGAAAVLGWRMGWF